MANKDVLIIIPAFNEASNIAELLISLKKSECIAYCDILVVNDASADMTSMIAKQLGVSVVSHVFNLGYGSALQIGYKYAVRGGYKYVIQLDADGQHDVCNVPKIYEAMMEPNAADIILCSRFLPGSVSFHVSSLKKVAMAYFNMLIKLATKVKITDPTSGLQGLNREAFLYYSKYDNFVQSYPDANIIIQTLRYGLTYKEIPCVMHERISGVSMHSGVFKQIFYMFTVTMTIINVIIRDLKYPKRKITLDSIESKFRKLNQNSPADLSDTRSETSAQTINVGGKQK